MYLVTFGIIIVFSVDWISFFNDYKAYLVWGDGQSLLINSSVLSLDDHLWCKSSQVKICCLSFYIFVTLIFSKDDGIKCQKNMSQKWL